MGFFSNLFNYRCSNCGSKNTRIHRSAKLYTSFQCEDCGKGDYKLDSGYYGLQCGRCGSTSVSLKLCRFQGESQPKLTIQCNECGGWMK